MAASSAPALTGAVHDEIAGRRRSAGRRAPARVITRVGPRRGRRRRHGCGPAGPRRRGSTAPRAALPAPKTARPAAMAASFHSGVPFWMPTGISRCWRRCSASSGEVERRRWPTSGADVEHQRRVAEEVRRVRDLVEQQRDEVRDRRVRAAAATARSAASHAPGTGPDGPRPAPLLRRLLPPDHLGSGTRRGRLDACTIWGSRDDHNILWFGASRSVYTVVGALLAIFARKASGDRRAESELSPPVFQRRQRPACHAPPCARAWACPRAAAGTGRN